MDETRLYFLEPLHFDILWKVSNRKLKMSLRSIETFVTEYSKTYNVHANGITIYTSYKNNLARLGKSLFDPFARDMQNNSLAVDVVDKNGRTCKSTIAQMNFIKWAIESGTLAYLDEHEEEVRNFLKKKKLTKLCRQKKRSRVFNNASSRGSSNCALSFSQTTVTF